jgi:RNA polymerase sigma factor for flagellar operon FliA
MGARAAIKKVDEVEQQRRVVELAGRLSDPAQRNAIISEYVPLIKRVAYKIALRLPPSIEVDDLVSAGVLGLMDAIGKYDIKKSPSFKSYAEIRIRGAILDELRNLDWVPRSVRQKTTEIDRTTRRLEQQLGRPADADEIAKEMGMEVGEFQVLVGKTRPLSIVSFEDLGFQAANERRNFMECLEDKKARNPYLQVQVQRIRDIIRETVNVLPEKQRIVITLYYFEDLNLKEIGEVLEVTESRVSQLHSQAAKTLKLRLRRYLEQ